MRNDERSWNANNQGASKSNLLSFTTTLSAASANNCCSRVGPFVDDGAPFSSMGIVEIRLLSGVTTIDDESIDMKPPPVASFESGPYDQGVCASNRCLILGSVNITAISDNSRITKI